jgi:uncharacterized protein involved in exopolysaccharide biosynthesis
VIRLRFRWSNPQFAAFAANAFAEEYVRRRIQVYAASGGERFYDEQIRLSQGRLEDIERQLEEFRKRNGISDVTLQRELLLREISQLNRDNETAGIALQDLQVKRERVHRTFEKTAEWPETPVVGEIVPDMTALDARYVAALADRNKLLDTYDPNSRILQSQNAQIEMLRQQKFQALDSFIGAQIASVTTRRNLIGAALAQKQASVANLDRSMVTLRDLERQRTLIEQDYSLYAKKVEEFRISEALSTQRISSVRILGPAVPQEKPVKPALLVTMALAALMGLFLGFAYATISEYFDHSFRGTHDVKAVLGVPLLASIPDAKRDAMAAGPPIRG